MVGLSALDAKLSQKDPLFGLIEEAYAVFATAKPASTGVCECCTDAAIQRDFFEPDIRQLPLRTVQDWFDGAVQPWPLPQATWTYLLPRLLEILAAGEEPSRVAIEVTLSRFATGEPSNWSPRQGEVLDRFQRQFLVRSLPPQPGAFDDILCMFRLGGWPLADLLDQVGSFPTAALAERLWHDWCAGVVPGREDIWLTAFWEEPDRAAVLAFTTSPALRARFEALEQAADTDPELSGKTRAVLEIMARASGRS